MPNRLSRDKARELALTIHEEIDPNLPLVDPPSSGGDTTHLSVMDAEGNAVGITQSIEKVYGSKAVAPGLGFLYNNYMSAFDYKDPSHPYYLRPGGIPWSTVAPSILFREKKPWLVLGSPGSERIYSTVSQFLIHVLDGNLSLDQAMSMPRFHCSIGGKISYEAERFRPELGDYLKRMGYKLDPREPWAFYLGAIHAVMRCRDGETFQGAAEPRRDGTACSPEDL